MRKKRVKGNKYDLPVANRVRDLMTRHGITERAQAGKLGRVLKVSDVHAYRKLRGQSPWTLDQIGQVATYFGETMGSLLDVTDKGMAHEAVSVEAVLVFDEREILCRARIGDEISGSAQPDYVAIRQNNQWRIYEPHRAPPTTGVRYAVESAEIRLRQSAEGGKPSIGVVDDDKDSADGICELLKKRGYKAKSYYTAPMAREAVLKGTHDGYVIDWLLDTETAESLIREIRTSANPVTPIVLLTGQLNTGRAEEDDIARVISSYGVQWLEKPVRISVLLAELARKLRRQPPEARGD